MGQILFIRSGISALRQFWKFLQELDQKGVDILSDQGAREVRKWLEVRAMRAAMYEDTKIAKAFKVFGRGVRWPLIVLKSDSLRAVDEAQGDDAKLTAAIKALEEKQTLYTRPTYPAH